MKATNLHIGNFEAEFDGMMIHGTVAGVEFSEYLTIKEGQAVVERVDSNIKCNMQNELESTGLDAVLIPSIRSYRLDCYPYKSFYCNYLQSYFRQPI